MTDTVTLTFRADTRNVSLARTVAAAMSARADLPLDQLEDVRLAVDEAVSQLILEAPAGADITCSFQLVGPDLDITVSAPSVNGLVPSTDTFSWTVLSALVDSVTASIEEGTLTLDLHVVRHIPVDA
jgi:serine/threonine-protein kinase RsbW